jgi:cytochrome c553
MCILALALNHGAQKFYFDLAYTYYLHINKRIHMISLHSVFLVMRKKTTLVKGVTLACMLFSLSACAEPGLKANIKDGEKKSTMCGQCHGKNGIAIIPIYPNLAGQKQGYMELQLKAFRSGERINAAMTPHAQRLSDQDIVDLSAYYAAMDPSGKKVSGQSQ